MSSASRTPPMTEWDGVLPWENPNTDAPQAAKILIDWLEKEGRSADDLERDLWEPMRRLELSLTPSAVERRYAEEACTVCGGRPSACAILGHRPESDRGNEWRTPLAPSSIEATSKQLCPLCRGPMPTDEKTLQERLAVALSTPMDPGVVLDPTDQRLKAFSKPERRRIIAAMCACEGISTPMLEATCPSEFDVLKMLEEKVRTLQSAIERATGKYPFHFEGRLYYTDQRRMTVAQMLFITDGNTLGHVFSRGPATEKRQYFAHGDTLDMTGEPWFFIDLPARM